MTTGMERLLAAASGRTSDRIPIFVNMSDQGAPTLGLSIEEYFRSGEAVAEAQLAMREKYDYDNLWSLFYVGKEAELLGCKEILFSEYGPPNVLDFILKKPEDIHRLVIPDDIGALPEFAEQKKCLQILKRESAGRWPVCAYLTASMTMPALLMGMERWMDLALNGPFSLRDELLGKLSDFFRRQVRAIREAGADILIYANPFGSTDFVPMKFFEETSVPWMERDVTDTGVADMVYYCGMARLGEALTPVMERLKFPTYYLSPLDDIAAGKKVIGGRGLTAGVINDIELIDWTPEEVRAEVKRMLAAGMPGGKFFFGTGVMPFAIPEANIRAMVEAAKEFGAQG
ncbi:MAG: uroporphyrinogen decarboxylase family protein [Nitrospinae bacterium]|nr:uroporphyrinogen decarboxylase family protein [Nitrospinota bacterium]